MKQKIIPELTGHAAESFLAQLEKNKKNKHSIDFKDEFLNSIALLTKKKKSSKK